MIRIEKPIIVEGKYDKITLENVVDAVIIPTDGFRIFKDKEKCRLIRTLAQKNGIVIMTDSDGAGAVIRSYLKKIVGNAEIINVYIPQLNGKERRKSAPSKEGFLGVEGMKPQIIEEVILRSGLMKNNDTLKRRITKADLYSAGLSGTPLSSENRKSFLRFISLPETLSSSAMLDVINTMFTFEEFEAKAALWQSSTDKG